MATSRSKRFGSEEVNQQVGGRKGQRKCVPCQKKRKDVVAAKYCYDCKQYQCEECSQCHVLFDAMAGHKLEHVQNTHSGKSQVDMKGLDMCSSHDKLFEYICIEHDELCCATCAIVLHRGCKVKEISTEASSAKISLADVTKDLESTETSANELLKNLKAQSTDDTLHKQYQLTIKTIDDAKQKIVSRFDDLTAEVTSKYQEAEQANSQQIQANITESETVLDEVQTSAKLLTEVDQHALEYQKYVATKVMKQRAASRKSRIRKMQAKSYKLELPFQFHKETKDVLNEDLALANYHINTIPLYPDIPVQDMAMELKLSASVEVKKGKDDKLVPLYYGLDLLPDGRLVAIDNVNKRVCLMDDRLRKLGTCTLDYVPRGVAVISGTDVAVICFGALLILRLNKSNSFNIIRNIDTDSASNYSGLSKVDKDLFLVGAYRDDEDFVSLITIEGKELFFANLPARKYGVDASHCTYMRNRNCIVHVDTLANAVTMYKIDEEGSVEKQVVVSDVCIQAPGKVCCLPDDSLLVCSKGTKSLVHISPDGSIISSHKLEMKCPMSVCVSTDGKKVVVFDSLIGKYKLQLFNVIEVHV